VGCPGGQVRFPGPIITTTKRTTPKHHVAAPELASLLDGSSAGGLIPVLARYGLQQLIERRPPLRSVPIPMSPARSAWSIATAIGPAASSPRWGIWSC